MSQEAIITRNGFRGSSNPVAKPFPLPGLPFNPERASMRQASDALADTWAARLIRAGLFLIVLFTVASFELNLYLLPEMPSQAVGLHLLDIFVASIALAATFTRWFERHWAVVTVVTCMTVIAGMTDISLLTRRDEALF